MKSYRNATPLVLAALMLVGWVFAGTSCNRGTAQASSEPVAESVLALGTVCRITIYDNPSSQAFSDAFERINEIERRMSRRLEDSEVSQINRAAGISSVKVSSDTFGVIKEALSIAAISSGAFDPTIGPVVAAWDIGSDAARKPPQEELDALLPLVDFKDVVLDEEASTVRLMRKGMQLDLGGIAKGYAADEVAKVLQSHGVGKAIVNLGGNVRTVGTRPDGTPWRIGIQTPGDERGVYLMIVRLDDSSLVTSGPYERFLEVDGEVYHHILDTKTGYPVSTSFTSVSIITSDSFVADALSTAVFSLGLDRGMALVESLPEVEAVFVSSGQLVHVSSGLARNPDLWEITDGSYAIAP